MEDDWWQQPTIRFVATAGGWGMGAAIAGWVGLGLLDLVEAGNERVWLVFSWIGRLGAVAWIGSWGTIIVWGTARWLARRLR